MFFKTQLQSVCSYEYVDILNWVFPLCTVGFWCMPVVNLKKVAFLPHRINSTMCHRWNIQPNCTNKRYSRPFGISWHFIVSIGWALCHKSPIIVLVRYYFTSCMKPSHRGHAMKLTLFLPKTNIFVHGKNCTFSKKGLGYKGRCYSVCIDDTCKWISHILSRIIGPSHIATKIKVPILDTGHMA